MAEMQGFRTCCFWALATLNLFSPNWALAQDPVNQDDTLNSEIVQVNAGAEQGSVQVEELFGVQHHSVQIAGWKPDSWYVYRLCPTPGETCVYGTFYGPSKYLFERFTQDVVVSVRPCKDEFCEPWQDLGTFQLSGASQGTAPTARNIADLEHQARDYGRKNFADFKSCGISANPGDFQKALVDHYLKWEFAGRNPAWLATALEKTQKYTQTTDAFVKDIVLYRKHLIADHLARQHSGVAQHLAGSSSPKIKMLETDSDSNQPPKTSAELPKIYVINLNPQQDPHIDALGAAIRDYGAVILAGQEHLDRTDKKLAFPPDNHRSISNAQQKVLNSQLHILMSTLHSLSELEKKGIRPQVVVAGESWGWQEANRENVKSYVDFYVLSPQASDEEREAETARLLAEKTPTRENITKWYASVGVYTPDRWGHLQDALGAYRESLPAARSGEDPFPKSPAEFQDLLASEDPRAVKFGEMLQATGYRERFFVIDGPAPKDGDLGRRTADVFRGISVDRAADIRGALSSLRRPAYYYSEKFEMGEIASDGEGFRVGAGGEEEVISREALQAALLVHLDSAEVLYLITPDSKVLPTENYPRPDVEGGFVLEVEADTLEEEFGELMEKDRHLLTAAEQGRLREIVSRLQEIHETPNSTTGYREMLVAAGISTSISKGDLVVVPYGKFHDRLPVRVHLQISGLENTFVLEGAEFQSGPLDEIVSPEKLAEMKQAVDDLEVLPRTFNPYAASMLSADSDDLDALAQDFVHHWALGAEAARLAGSRAMDEFREFALGLPGIGGEADRVAVEDLLSDRMDVDPDSLGGGSDPRDPRDPDGEGDGGMEGDHPVFLIYQPHASNDPSVMPPVSSNPKMTPGSSSCRAAGVRLTRFARSYFRKQEDYRSSFLKQLIGATK